MNRQLALISGIRIRVMNDAVTELPACNAVCDALFGTGLSRQVTGDAARLIAMVNEAGLPVCAVDIPSGLNGTTGMPEGCAVRADETVTFHRLKTGLVTGHSADYTGRITVAPILIPGDYGDWAGISVMLSQDLGTVLPPRLPSCHKGSNGRVVILAGSIGMAGAAALCADAAIRSGAGLTQILARASIVPILQVLVPGATCVALPEQNGMLTDEAADIAAKALGGASAAAIGPGLGQTQDLLPLVRVFSSAACPVVWDADALNLLSGHPELLPLPAKDMITPHPGEASRLIGVSAGTDLHTLEQLHRLTGCNVLLKGARTLMTDGSRTAVNITGSPAMAKGGSGDVLTGIIAGLTAQRIISDPLVLLQTAALIHGMAGQRAAGLLGERCITPQDLCAAIRMETGA